MIDILLYSHHLPAWYCIDIVRRNSVLITCGSERVKFASKKLYASTVLCKNWIIYVVYINNLYCECFEIKKIIVLYVKKYCYQWLSEYVSSDVTWTCPVYLWIMFTGNHYTNKTKKNDAF